MRAWRVCVRDECMYVMSVCMMYVCIYVHVARRRSEAGRQQVKQTNKGKHR